MFLLITATEKEMNAFRRLGSRAPMELLFLVSGVGPLETGISVTRFLEAHHNNIEGVINFGIGGAYLSDALDSLNMLDICLAQKEVLGDFGVCYEEDIESFNNSEFSVPVSFDLDPELLDTAGRTLTKNGMEYSLGTFVTVNGASGTRSRGEKLSRRFQAVCENMEGAAIARVCEVFDVPLLEVRAISNLVENRPGSEWKFEEAAVRAATAASIIINSLKGLQ